MKKLFMLICLLAVVNVSLAANNVWQGDLAGDGLWWTPGNWSLGTIPTAPSGDVAVFNSDIYADCTINDANGVDIDAGIIYMDTGVLNIDSTNVETAGIFVGNPLGYAGTQGPVLNLNGSSAISLPATGEPFKIGIGAILNDAAMNMYGTSSVDVGFIRFGQDTGEKTGTLNMYGSSSLTIAKQFELGWQGTGIITMTDDSVLTSSAGISRVGRYNDGATVAGTNELNLSGNAELTAYGLDVGWLCEGQLTASENAVINVTGDRFRVGRNGNASASGAGTASFSGSAQLTSANWLQMGVTFYSPGTLNISDSALVDVQGSFSEIGVSGYAEVNVSGGELRANRFSIGTPWNGAAGVDRQGVLNISGDGLVNVNTISVAGDGGARNNINTVTISGNGTLQVRTAIETNGSWTPGYGTYDINDDGQIVIFGDQTSVGSILASNGEPMIMANGRTRLPDIVYSEADDKTYITAPDINAAYQPTPENGADIQPITGFDVDLGWLPGASAVKHHVFIGTVSDEVEAIAPGDTASPMFLTTINDPDPLTYTYTAPEPDTFFWRVDAEKGDGTITKGAVWQFTVNNYITLDDFEEYEGGDRDGLFNTIWSAGGSGSIQNQNEDNYVAGLPYTANPDNKVYEFANDDYALRLNFVSSSDCTAIMNLSALGFSDIAGTGLAAIEIPYRTYNAGESNLSVIFSDGVNSVELTYTPDDPNLNGLMWETGSWDEFFVDLDDITAGGVDLSSVDSMTLKIANAGDSGEIYFDDLRLYYPYCNVIGQPGGDYAGGDCGGEIDDFMVLAAYWQEQGLSVTPTAATTAPLAWYKFDESAGATTAANAQDLSGDTDMALGTGSSPSLVVFGEAGKNGNAVLLDGELSVELLEMANATNIFDQVTDQITFSFWFYGAQRQAVRNFTLNGYLPNNDVRLELCTPWENGAMLWKAGNPASTRTYLRYYPDDLSEVQGQWNHIAVTKDTTAGTSKIYMNGVKVRQESRYGQAMTGTSTDSIMGISKFIIHRYTGKIDDLKIYNYELSADEIAYEAGLTTPFVTPFPDDWPDANDDNVVGLDDAAALFQIWQQEVVWP